MKRKKKPNFKQQKTTLIIVVAIAIVAMLATSFHENNVKNYNYIKESWFDDLIYTSYYDDRNEYYSVADDDSYDCARYGKARQRSCDQYRFGSG